MATAPSTDLVSADDTTGIMGYRDHSRITTAWLDSSRQSRGICHTDERAKIKANWSLCSCVA